LDISTVTQLGNSPTWYVPTGLKAWFTSVGITNVVELGWWKRATFNSTVDVVCTPCQHWSKRNVLTKCETLWGSWCVIGKTKRVYFSGDTGYCSVFQTIGKQFGPFDLSLIAIGAYCPRHFMQPQHVDPVEAVQVHTELKSKLSLGIHWGTFILANEPEDEPPQLLQKELDNRKMSRSEFITTSIGQTITTKTVVEEK